MILLWPPHINNIFLAIISPIVVFLVVVVIVIIPSMASIVISFFLMEMNIIFRLFHFHRLDLAFFHLIVY